MRWLQAFHNYDQTCDIFNHSNLIYWQISLPGLDGWNNISCTGTNFVVRARAAQEVCYPFSSVLGDTAQQQHSCKRLKRASDGVHWASMAGTTSPARAPTSLCARVLPRRYAISFFSVLRDTAQQQHSCKRCEKSIRWCALGLNGWTNISCTGTNFVDQLCCARACCPGGELSRMLHEVAALAPCLTTAALRQRTDFTVTCIVSGRLEPHLLHGHQLRRAHARCPGGELLCVEKQPWHYAAQLY